MQILVWIVIIFLVILLIWLLRRWIRRLIFIAILLCLAFLIYGIFSPSGASRLRYNLRTFPRRVTSRVSNQKFLDYDSYKLSSIGSESDDEIDEVHEDDNLEEKVLNENPEKNVENSNILDDVKENTEIKGEKMTIKSFPSLSSVKFIEVSDFTKKTEITDNIIGSGYSEADLLKVIGKYVEEKLDDDMDILVTVEYEDDDKDPEKIILQTLPRGDSDLGSASKSNLSAGIKNIDKNNSENSDNIGDSQKTVEKSSKNTQKTPSNVLTSKEVKETEEIFSILFQ